MTRTRKILVAIVILLFAIQLVPVSRTNPPVTGEIEIPGETRALLERSCYDCHSNETAWPWYSRIAPASWLVARDVARGRDELNFSEWGDYSVGRREHKLEEVEEMVEIGKMPLRIYLPLHPDARLSEDERRDLIEWARARRAALPAEVE